MSVRQTINQPDHKFRAEQIFAIDDMVNKNKARWNNWLSKKEKNDK